jgi:predicted dinucleotide-binding enzyme
MRVPHNLSRADVGFKPEYVGPIRAARNLEYMAELWVHMTYKYKTHDDRGFAFGITEKA